MDLATLDVTAKAEQGAWLTLRHPGTGDDLPVRIRLAGKDSKAWKDAEREYSDRRLEEIQKRGKMGKVKTAQIEERGIKLLAMATLEWEGVELNGQTLECTRQNAIRLYTEHVWITEQVDEFVGDRANFLVVADGEDSKTASVFDGDAHLAEIVGN
jgi:hypothetical protein